MTDSPPEGKAASVARKCVLGPDVHDGLHRDEDGNTWDHREEPEETEEPEWCGCSRPDLSDDPHRHPRDDWCALWSLAYAEAGGSHMAARRAWIEGRMAVDRINHAKHALVDVGYFTADEVSDDVAPRIHELNTHWQDDVVADLVDAIRLTVEYVGMSTLPPLDGWSWYDALRKHAPEVASAMVAAVGEPKPEHESVNAAPPPRTVVELIPSPRLGWVAETVRNGPRIPPERHWALTAAGAERRARAAVERRNRRRTIEIEE